MSTDAETDTLTLGAAVAEGIIVVEVGPNAKKYHIHRPLLTYYSGFFKRALARASKEALEVVVRLDDVEPEVFDVFVIYTKKLFDGDENLDFDCGGSRDAHCDPQRCFSTIKTYALADQLMAPGLRRDAAEKVRYLFIYNTFGLEDFYSMVSYAFKHIPPGSVVLQLLVDEYWG